MSSIDQQFVEYIIKSIVGNPDDISIERTIDEKGVLLELTVNPEDLGRVIGKRGATAQSIRTLLRALGTKNDARYNLKIVDNTPEGSRPPRREDDRPARSDDEAPRDDTTAPVDDSTATPASDDDSTDDTTPKKDDLADLRDDDDDTSASVSRTRKELEDLDDLDV